MDSAGSSDHFMVSWDVLRQFFSLVADEAPALGSYDFSTNALVLSHLGSAAFVREFLEAVMGGPLSSGDVTPGVEDEEGKRRTDREAMNLREAIFLIDESLNGKYSTFVDEIQTQLSMAQTAGDISSNLRHHIGELLVLLSVESEKAGDIVKRIVSDLTAEAQLEIQGLIERVSSEETLSSEAPATLPLETAGDLAQQFTESLSSNQSSSDGFSQRQGLGARQRPPTSPVPLLSLGLLRAKSKRIGDGGEHPLWKKKYDQLNEEYQKSEALREQLQTQMEQLRKGFDEQKQLNDKLTHDIKETTQAKQSSVAEVVDALEREVHDLKKKLEEAIKDKKENEKTLQGEISNLRDENHLLSVDAAEIPRLRASIEKWKEKGEELTMSKSKVKELEERIQQYATRLADSQSATQASPEFKKALDMYRNKATTLEVSMKELMEKNGELQHRVAEQTAALEEAERKRMLSDMKVKSLMLDLDAGHADTEGSTGIGDELGLSSEVARLRKELETLRSGGALGASDQRLMELECDLDNERLLRIKTEKELEKTLDKLRVWETDSSPSSDASRLKQMELEKELGIFQAKVETVLTQNKALEVQLEQEKARASIQEDAIRGRLESQYETVISTLKAQVQLRERQANFLSLLREEETAAQRREQRLMSGAFHELGYLFFQMKGEKERIASEYEAVMMKGAEEKKAKKRSSTAALAVTEASSTDR